MRVFIITFLFMGLLQTGHTQQRNLRNNQRANEAISVGGHLEIPQGMFSNEINGVLLGMHGSFMTTSRIPFIKAGINFSATQLGRYRDETSVYQGESVDGLEVYENADLLVKHRNHKGHGAIRFQPFKRGFQPYLEGMAGLSVFSSSAKFTQGERRERYTLEKENIERSITSSYGWAAGAKFRVAPKLFIEARYEELTGGNASFILPDSFNMNQKDIFEYDLINSRTSSSLVKLGVTLEF